MNIKQAERLSGISRRNIRFYEQEGMIQPARNRENDYREYADKDIQTLKLIRALRMVDMPLEQIKSVLHGEIRMEQAAAGQVIRLKQKTQELETAIRFCQELGCLTNNPADHIDRVLEQMDNPGNYDKLFHKWLKDYKLVANAQCKKVFTFIPDGAITTPAEFTMELCRHANENDLDLVITKEGMYPEFTLNGIEYTAERLYTSACRVPVATVRCTAKYPQELEADLPKGRRVAMKLLHHGWLYAVLLLLNMVVLRCVMGEEAFTTPWGWVLLFSLLAFTGVNVYRFNLFTYNCKGR